ncbi:hypothetical protein ECB98_24990 [Brucellaceae bacterium VT-16-1752]|nr:hypothetical protein ECB98_24990 [Brucellaceae bacterium VT-16-1752]
MAVRGRNDRLFSLAKNRPEKLFRSFDALVGQHHGFRLADWIADETLLMPKLNSAGGTDAELGLLSG